MRFHYVILESGTNRTDLPQNWQPNAHHRENSALNMLHFTARPEPCSFLGKLCQLAFRMESNFIPNTRFRFPLDSDLISLVSHPIP